MRSDDVANYLGDIHRLLRPKGRVFFTVYVEDDCENEAENPIGYLNELGVSQGALHRVRFRKAYFESLIKDAGLSIVDFFYRSENATLQSSYLLETTCRESR
jgi:hypothetical protein